MRPLASLTVAAVLLQGIAHAGARSERVTSVRLENGLRLLVMVREDVQLPAVSLSVRVGAADDPAGRAGMAHILEHASHGGHADDPDGDGALEDRGAVGINATTSRYLTQYFCRLPARAIPFWLEVQAARLRRQTLWDFERKRTAAVLEALEFVTGRGPDLVQAVPDIGGLGSVFGWPADMESVDREAALGFFRRAYMPERIVVAVVGNVDPQSVSQHFRRLFSSWTPPRSSFVDAASRVDTIPRYIRTRHQGVSGLLVAFRIRPPFGRILQEWFSSPTFSPVRQAEWRMSMVALSSPPEMPSSPLLEVVNPPGGLASPDAIGRLLATAVEGAAEVELRSAIRASLTRMAEATLDPASMASLLGVHELLRGRAATLFDDLEVLRTVDPRGVRSAVRESFDWRLAKAIGDGT
jgi:predicted Zn-dependent peptidase